MTVQAKPMAPAAEWTPGTFHLRDAWFPVAHVPELKQTPVRRHVHSQPYYLWRDDRRLRATDYHPAAARTGECSVFTNAHGDYPVREQYGHIWVWYGDPDHADPALIPDIPFLPRRRAQPAYARGVNYFHCTYELVLENILDLTHIDFVHGNFSGNAGADEDRIEFLSTSETVTMIRTIKNRKVSDYQRDVLGITAKYQDQTAFTHVFIRSGMCFLHSHYSAAPSIPLMQSNTPESRTLVRANYVFGIQQTDNARYAHEWPLTASIVAAQDARVLDPQNPLYLDQKYHGDCSTRFDAAGLHFRQRYNALVERQARGDYSYLPDAADGADLAEILHIKRMA